MPPSASASVRRPSGRRSFLWTLKPSGTRSSSSFRWISVSAESAVSDRGAAGGGGADRRAGGAVEFAGARGDGRILVVARVHPLAKVFQRRRHLGSARVA